MIKSMCASRMWGIGGGGMMRLALGGRGGEGGRDFFASCFQLTHGYAGPPTQAFLRRLLLCRAAPAVPKHAGPLDPLRRRVRRHLHAKHAHVRACPGAAAADQAKCNSLPKLWDGFAGAS